MNRSRLYLLVLGVFVLIFIASPIMAQPDDDSDIFMLEEITVTATKREENLQKVALSGTSLVGENLQKTGRTVLTQMLQDTAGIEIKGTAQDSGIFIRGIGENTKGMGVETNVSISTNGVYSTSTQLNRMSQYDVARVEVTRGPDSTLNGRSAEGGSISIITNEPAHSFEGGASMTIGNYDLFSTQGVLNLPAGEDFALRGAFTSVERDGYMTNGKGDLDNLSGRIRGLYEPNDVFKVILTTEYNKSGGKGRGPVSYTTPIDLSKPFTTPKGAYYSPVEAPSYESSDAYNYYADITYDLGWASVYFQPTYQTTDYANALYNQSYDADTTDLTPDRWSGEFSAREQEQKTLEMRLTSPDSGGPLTWLAGIFYVDFEERQQTEMVNNVTEMPTIQYPKVDGDSAARFTEDTAVYAQGTYNLSDTIRLSLGGRYTKDEKRRPWASSSAYYYYLDDGIENSSTGEKVYYDTDADTSTTERFDYKVSLQKDLAEESMVYFLVSTGFKGGGFNNLPSDSSVLAEGYSTAYDPEYLTSYEIGTKNQLFANTFRLNASFFYYDYRDIQLNFRGSPFRESTGVDPDYAKGVIQNGGHAVSYGFEIETDYLLTGKDRVGLDIAYLNSEFKTMDFAPLYYLEGMELPESPNWRINPSYEHTFSFGENGELVANVSGTYVSEAMYSIPNSVECPYNIREDYFKANTTFTYYSADGRWSVAAYARNLFDKQTYDYIAEPMFYSGYGSVMFIASEPRMVGMTLSANF